MGYVWCTGVRYLFLFAICAFDGCVMRAFGFYLLGSRHISGFRVAQLLSNVQLRLTCLMRCPHIIHGIK